MRKILFSVTAMFALGAMATAGGDIDPVPAAPVDSWSGWYGGVQVGYNSGKSSVEAIDLNANFTFSYLNPDPKGSEAGLYAGYNWLFGNGVLLGLEGGINVSGAKDSVVNSGGNTNFDFQLEESVETYLGTKVGMVLRDTYMPYLIGGASYVQLRGRWYYKPNPGSTPWEAWQHDSVWGWFVGAGVEVKVSESIHLRAQYRYIDYREADFYQSSGGYSYEEKTDYEAHKIELGLTYRF